MKLSLGIGAALTLIAATTVSAQTPTITDSIGVPTAVPAPTAAPAAIPALPTPAVSAPSVVSSPHSSVGSPVVTPSQSYAGDIAPIDAGVSQPISSGTPVSSGEVVNEGEYIVGGEGLGFQQRAYGRPDLFYNYFTQGNSNGLNAQLYMSPHPVPPNVGHTFYTYQPFYPHHYMYAHKDRYHNYYDGGRGYNRTRATYSYPPVRQAITNLYWNKIRLPR